MASWDDSGPPIDTAAVQPGAGSETIVERARRLVKRLLKRLFTERRRDDWSPLPRL